LIAYKFLVEGALGPSSGLAWPKPYAGSAGAWVEVLGPLAQCAEGVHVCRPADLAHWLNDELWEVETGSEEQPGIDCTIVRQARLRRRIDSWNERGRAQFAEACTARATALLGSATDEQARGLIDDAKLSASAGYIAVSAYCAALSVTKLAAPAQIEAVYRAERRWQSAFIARELLGL
jgi:hypothetical protein